MKSLMKTKVLVILLTLAMLVAMTMPMVFAETEPTATLVVTYDDGETTTTSNRDHRSRVLHFDVYRDTGALATSAVLTFADERPTVYWEVDAQGPGGGSGTLDNPFWQGSENADLTGSEIGYWHWVYTASGVLTISNSSGDEEEEPKLGKLSIIKFYDANANGEFDNGEAIIEDWKVKIYIGDVFYGCVETPYEIENIIYGTTFRIVECESTTGNWRSTTPTEYTVTVGSDVDGLDVEVEFGNLCLGEGGGYTMGFWGNRNGQRIFEDDIDESIAALTALNLKDATGDTFVPEDHDDFRSWLRGANAENMQYMLSAQLAAMRLNVLWQGVEGNALVYAPGVLPNSDYISIGALINLANEALANEEASREYMELLKDALDSANNNENFVQSEPCDNFAFDCCDEE
ncbi:hypothetical protein [Dethiobacter alkaliphilus]|uniref:Uncharacterized protein n=1 Tax=Dethiobacter alkaliphilus AHT 1 TaxID=555088 RepID=C0GEE6_DETAL|nr:hypothetical protein [Dethiobacter alkaliphilus]EEG78440.1 hypothetical protein DealDRAFT_0855 [Dethiobacter alkaliphilus AHT 1]